MDPATIRAAKRIVSRREEGEEAEVGVEARLAAMEAKLDTLLGLLAAKTLT